MFAIENPEETYLRIAFDRFTRTIGEFAFVCKTLKDYKCRLLIQGDDVIMCCGDKYVHIEGAMPYVKDFASLVRGYADV